MRAASLVGASPGCTPTPGFGMKPTQSGVFLLQNSIVLDFVVCTGVPIPSQIPISQNPAFGG